MRALAAVVLASLLSSCTATLLFEPQVLVSPYLAVYQLRGKVGVQDDPGGGQPLQDNPQQPMRTFGHDRHKEDVGVRIDVGDGFAGLRVDYYRLDMGTSHTGRLGADWGALQAGDLVQMRAEMDELRIGYLEPLWASKTDWREQPLSFEFAAGAVLAHRAMHLRAQTEDGVRRQTLRADGDSVYPAARFRAGWRDFTVDAEYAISPRLDFGGDFGGVLQDLELRASWAMPLRDLVFFAGYRYSELSADGHDGALGYDADLVLDGFQLGMTISF